MKALSHAIFLRHYQDGESQPLLMMMMMMMATLSTTLEDLPSPLAAPPSSRFLFATPRVTSEAEDSPSKRALAQRVSAGRHAQPRVPRGRLHADSRHRRIRCHARPACRSLGERCCPQCPPCPPCAWFFPVACLCSLSPVFLLLIPVPFSSSRVTLKPFYRALG